VHAQTVDKSNDIKNSFYEKLECVSDQFLKYHMKILLDFSAKVERENIFKLTVGNGSIPEISNDDGVIVTNFDTSKNLSRGQCSHIITFINTLGFLLMGKHTD
jgi:hypothetical protein